MLLEIDLLSWKTWSIPILDGLIGWITTWLAIKMLFKPRKPVNLFGLYSFQGIFPKNKKRIADNLGKIVQRDLINFSDIKNRLQEGDAINHFRDEIAEKVDDAIRDRLGKTPILDAIVPEQLIQAVHKTIVDEIEKNLPEVIGSSVEKIAEKLDIHQLVKNKINAFSDEKLESVLMNITSKEFTFIEVLCGILGFLIGIVQMLIQYS